jgi:A/G-specific adenine glycosylase
LLITQREPTAMLGGLWKFPGTRCNPSEMLEDCLRRGVYEEVGLEVEIGQPVTTIRHAYTHFRITLHAFECRYLGGEPRALGCADWRWVLPADLLKYAFPVTDQKIAVALG